MTELETLPRRQLGSGPYEQTLLRQDISDLNSKHNNLLAALADSIVGLTKELRSVQRVYALDFQLLRAYLFPSLERDKENLPLNLISYFFDKTSISFILPPGTINEIFSFAKLMYPRIEELISFVTQADEPGKQDEALNRFNKLHPELGFKASHEDLFAKMIKVLSSDIDGFRGLDSLLQSGRIKPLSDFFSEIGACDFSAALENSISGALRGAGSQPRSAGSQRRQARLRNIENDAKNLAWTLTFNHKMQDRWIAGKAENVWYAQLITETSDLLDLRTTDYGKDIVGEETALGFYRQKRGHSWITGDLWDAVMSTFLQNTFINPFERLKEAETRFDELEKLSIESRRMHDKFGQRNFDQKEAKDLVSRHESFLFETPILRRLAYNPQSPTSDESSSAVQNLVGRNEMKVKYFQRQVVLPYTSAETRLFSETSETILLFDIQVQTEKCPSEDDVTRELIITRGGDSRLMELFHWRSSSLTTLKWEAKIVLSDLLAVLNKLLADVSLLVNPGVWGEVTVSFDFLIEENQAYEKSLFKLPTSESLSLSRLVYSNELLKRERFLQYPRTLSINTALGDIHIDIVAAANEATTVIDCVVFDGFAYRMLIEPLLRQTHGWRGISSLIDDISQVAFQLCSSKE